MAGFDDKFLSELKQKNNIVDVVGRYCVLQRKGSNFWACCPLPGHSEKTASFTVNEPGQFYKCFGCGKHGDVITFIQEVESLTFIEAVKHLAEKSGMQVPDIKGYEVEKTRKEKEKKDRLYSLMKDTALFYVSNLKQEKAQEMIEYLINRGFNSQTIRKFGIGVSLDYNSLPKFLLSKGYAYSEMLETGVCQKSSKNNSVFDAEAERIVIPIINSMGKVIAFGGRTLKNSGFAKYKNTQETTLFNKSNTLFGINNLKQLKNDNKLPYVIMVEGYMDVISLFSGGFENAVASMGTSLTLQQAKILKRYVDKVYVSFDGDGAGQKATIRSLDIFANEGFDVRVVELPKGLDPDDVIRKQGKEAYQNLIDNALPLIDYKFKLLSIDKNLNDSSDRRAYLKSALAFISSLKDAFLQEELLKKVRDQVGVSYEALKRDLENGSATSLDVKQEVVINYKPKTADKVIRAERFILWAILNGKSYANNVNDGSFYFNDEVHEKIMEIIEYNPNVKPDNLYSLVTSQENSADYTEQINEILVAGEGISGKQVEQKYFNDCLITVKKTNLENEIKDLNVLYSNETDLAKRREIAEIIDKKTQKLIEL